MAEAVALVNTLPNWQVVDKLILSTKSPDNKLIFGKGNFETLTGNNFVQVLQTLTGNKESGLYILKMVLISRYICRLHFPFTKQIICKCLTELYESALKVT